jgi:5-methylcytosine-specific restriction endonuclease McrA
MSAHHDQPWRKGLAWKRLCKQVFSEETVCWLCFGAIDWNAPPRTPFSKSVDHVLPVETHPELALVRSNLHLAHFGCNSRRSARGNIMAGYEPSREW